MTTSHYERLPIYKSAMDLALKIDGVAKKLPRYHKYTLGQELRQQAMDLVLFVARANRREDRAYWVTELCYRTEDLKITCNLGRELRAFNSFKQFAQVMQQVVDVSRQAQGWRRSLDSKRPEPSGNLTGSP